MAESSRPWAGAVTGDCGPYTAEQWSVLFEYLFAGGQAASEGVLPGVLNGLAVSGAATPVSVATGAAMVKGKFYLNSLAVDVPVSTPVTATRIDRVVLRADWAAQTVRITKIDGVEGGGAPAITQVDGVTWDLPLAQVSVTTGGAITVTDEREYLHPAAAMLYRRQGLAAYDWISGGANNFSPGRVLFQAGVAAWSGPLAISGYVNVTFPRAYGKAPIIIAVARNQTAYRGIIVSPAVELTTGAALYWFSGDGAHQYGSVAINWVAVGEP